MSPIPQLSMWPQEYQDLQQKHFSQQTSCQWLTGHKQSPFGQPSQMWQSGRSVLAMGVGGTTSQVFMSADSLRPPRPLQWQV